MFMCVYRNGLAGQLRSHNSTMMKYGLNEKNALNNKKFNVSDFNEV